MFESHWQRRLRVTGKGGCESPEKEVATSLSGMVASLLASSKARKLEGGSRQQKEYEGCDGRSHEAAKKGGWMVGFKED